MKYVILVLVIVFAIYETVMLIKGIIQKVKEKKAKKSNEDGLSSEENNNIKGE